MTIPPEKQTADQVFAWYSQTLGYIQSDARSIPCKWFHGKEREQWLATIDMNVQHIREFLLECCLKLYPDT